MGEVGGALWPLAMGLIRPLPWRVRAQSSWIWGQKPKVETEALASFRDGPHASGAGGGEGRKVTCLGPQRNGRAEQWETPTSP